MKIGIDARLYKQTGVGRYLRNLISQLGQIDKHNSYIVYLRSKDFDLFYPPNDRWVKRRLDIPWHTIKEQLLTPFVFLSDNLDVVHFPYFNVPILYPKKYLLTIHDLIVDHFDTGRASTLPRIFYKVKRIAYRFATTIGIKRAWAITVISKTTKREVIEHYHTDPSKVIVTYDALDDFFLRQAKIQKPKRYYPFPYILYVGNAYPHKNLEKLLKPFRLLKKRTNVHLVLAGDDDYFYPRLKRYAEKEGISNVVHFFGNANDEQLVNLYTHSKLVVFPSLMEGFGLPNLEALACGVLPVVSDIPVFREVWGDDIIFFDPNSEKDIAGKLLHTLTLSRKDYQQRVEKAARKIKQFSWEKTAQQTLSLYKKVYYS